MSHYIPPYTRINGRKQETACGAWIDASEHSPEATCPACQEWLQRAANLDAETFTELGYVQNERGIWAPKES